MQTVWRESFALRYSLSDVLISAPSAVAAAQLAPIAYCADVNRPDRVPVIPPPVLSLFDLCGLLLRLRLRLCLLDPVGDGLVLLGSGRLADFLDECVFSSCISMSVNSSNFTSYFSICFSISSSWCLCHFASLHARRSSLDGPGHLQNCLSFQ